MLDNFSGVIDIGSVLVACLVSVTRYLLKATEGGKSVFWFSV